MLKYLQIMAKNLTLAIPLAMLAGLAFGLTPVASSLKVLILPLTFLMVYPMMVTLRLGSLLEKGDAKAQVLAQVINFMIIPFVAFGLGQVFFAGKPYYAMGLLLAALLPTSGMTISWTGFAGGNLGAAVKMTVLGLILGSLATPFFVQWLMGASVPVDLRSVFSQILYIVFLPMLAGQLTRSYLLKKHGKAAFQKTWAPRFPPFSTLGVIGIVFVAMALKSQQLLAHPMELLNLLPPLLALYSINFVLSTVVARLFLSRGDAIALVYGTVMRNLSIALALSMNAFGSAGSEAALVVALAYVIQVQSAAWYVKFTDRLFGEAAVADAPALGAVAEQPAR